MEDVMKQAARVSNPNVSSAPEPLRRVTGLFDGPERLSEAVQGLVEASFPADGIDVLMVDPTHGLEEVGVTQKTRVAAGATAGAAAGAALGLTAVTIFPGIGLLVGGPLLAALQGTFVGTIGGALNGLGWWRTEAELPTREIERGGALIGLEVPAARAEDAVSALRAAGAKRVDVH
jgi:phage tail tape-measure protein